MFWFGGCSQRDVWVDEAEGEGKKNNKETETEAERVEKRAEEEPDITVN